MHARSLHGCLSSDCPKNGKMTCLLCDDCGPPASAIREHGPSTRCPECGVAPTPSELRIAAFEIVPSGNALGFDIRGVLPPKPN